MHKKNVSLHSKYKNMNIETLLQQGISQALDNLYSISVEPSQVQLQGTKKEFAGDFTLVVFPFVKQARKAPEAVANEIGVQLKANLP